MNIYNKIKNNTIVVIDNQEDCERLQLVLFSHNIGWRDSGITLLSYTYGYDMLLRLGSSGFFVLWQNKRESMYKIKLSLTDFLKEIDK